jgi:prefoldin subunit 5
MADEREELLQKQIDELEEQIRVLAAKMEEVMGVDCDFGACVFDPEMSDVESKMAEVQRRKKTLEKIISDLEACEA